MVPGWVLVAAITACVALLWFTRRKRVDDAAKSNDDYLAPAFHPGSCESSTCRYYQEPPAPSVPTMAEIYDRNREHPPVLPPFEEIEIPIVGDGEPSGKVDDEPILCDTSDTDHLTKLAKHDNMRHVLLVGRPDPALIDELSRRGSLQITEPLMIPLPPVDVVPAEVKERSFKILAPVEPEPFNMSTPEEEPTEFAGTNGALRSLRQAIMGKVQKRARKAKTECWIWTGSSNLRFRGSSVRRVLWMWFKGPLSDNEMLKNDCGDDYCVAPDHQTATLRSKIASYKKK